MTISVDRSARDARRSLVLLALPWRRVLRGGRVSGRTLTGLLLVGWGLFNLVEGVVNHHLLRLHHVRDDVTDPRWWDLASWWRACSPWPRERRSRGRTATAEVW